jgi:hypothetical protein
MKIKTKREHLGYAQNSMAGQPVMRTSGHEMLSPGASSAMLSA